MVLTQWCSPRRLQCEASSRCSSQEGEPGGLPSVAVCIGESTASAARLARLRVSGYRRRCEGSRARRGNSRRPSRPGLCLTLYNLDLPKALTPHSRDAAQP